LRARDEVRRHRRDGRETNEPRTSFGSRPWDLGSEIPLSGADRQRGWSRCASSAGRGRTHIHIDRNPVW